MKGLWTKKKNKNKKSSISIVSYYNTNSSVRKLIERDWRIAVVRSVGRDYKQISSGFPRSVV
jgi:hypothetical protein